MPLPPFTKRSFEFRIRSVLLLALAALANLALVPALAAAASEEEGGPPSGEPVIVPEVETPVPPPVTLPELTPSPPSSAPVSKPSESAPTSSAPQPTHSTHTTHTSTGSTHGSGGSTSAPTTAHHASHHSSASGGSQQTGSSGSAESASPSSPAGSSAPGANVSTPSSQSSPVQRAAAHLAARAGHAPAKSRHGRQQAVQQLGKTLGTALLGTAAAVSQPEKKALPSWVPLPGKSKLPYVLLLFVVLQVVVLVIGWRFFDSGRWRYWKGRLLRRPLVDFAVSPPRPLPNARPSRLRATERASRRKAA
jgi:cobalamin biosynthesis Mg chelatase CobN